MTTVRTLWKLARLALHLTRALWTLRFVFPQLDAATRQQKITDWAQVLIDLLAIKLVVSGKPSAPGPMLLAANHISWLDIYIMLATTPCRFVAKAEVRQWPMIGRLAEATGTLFLSRQSPRDAVRVVQQMAAYLAAGDTLAIFPEGTTSNGRLLLPFHANLFQAAIAGSTPVQPVALQYLDRASGRTSMATRYVDDDTLLGSIWRTLSAPALCAEISFGPVCCAVGNDRRQLATQVRSVVANLLDA